MANTIKQITKGNGDKMNLGDIEQAAIKGVEQGSNVLEGKNTIPKPHGGIQRVTADAATTIAATDTLVDFAVNAAGSRVVTMPSAEAGRYIRCVWSVEQAGNDRVFTRAGSDTFAGNIFTSVAGNAAGDGDVVAIANTTVAITAVDDINIGSYIDFTCAVDGTWLVLGHLVVDAVGSVPTLA